MPSGKRKKFAQVGVVKGKGKDACEYDEEAIEAAATLEDAKKPEGLHLLEVSYLFYFYLACKMRILFYS